MLRKINILLLLALFASTALFAQNIEIQKNGGYARVMSMGMNKFITDPENMKVNTAWASSYSNLVWGDIGGNLDAGQFLGAAVGVTDQITAGAILSRNDLLSIYNAPIGRLDPSGLFSYVPSTIKLNNNIELFGSFKLNRDLSLGIGLSYAGTTNNTKPATGSETKISGSQVGINLGMVTSLNSSALLDIGVNLLFPSFSNETPGNTKVDASQTWIAADARMILGLSRSASFVPELDFYNVSGTYESGTKLDLPSTMHLALNFGFQYKTDKFLVAGGPGLAINSTTVSAIANVSPELKNSDFVFPVWSVGAEWYALDWLTGRIGYTGSTTSSTLQTPASLTTHDEFTATSYQPYQLTVGIGLHFGNFQLDAYVSNDVLRNGLANIGGNTPTFSYLSASINF